MKRNIKLLLIMMMPLLAFSACIFSTTPPAGPVSVTWGQVQTFTVYGLNSFEWFLDGSPIGTGANYTFVSSDHVLGNHNLKVRSTFSMGGIGVTQAERDWVITVKSPPPLVPTAASCADVWGVGLVCSTELQCSDEIAEGDVIAQTPMPGSSVPPGSTVKLIISSGLCSAHEVRVPAATNCASVEAAGFVCSTTTSCSDQPAGVVLYQDPVAGTMAMPGTTISLVLSSGPCTVEVEVPIAISCAEVEAAGFICSRIYACSNTAPIDSVMEQSPPAGLNAMPGSIVALTLSSGVCKLLVPDATTCEELEEVGLVCNQVSICSNAYPTPGEFIGLSPVAGTPISPGATVTLAHSIGPCTVSVPDANTCEEIETLSGGWLTCSTTYQCQDGTPAGIKLGQNPGAGTVVAAGSGVELIICSGNCPVMLPAPTNVSATDVVIDKVTYNPLNNNNFEDKVRVTWTAAAGAEYYKVYRANSAVSTYTEIGRTVGAETTFDDMQTNQEIPTLVLPAWPELPSDDAPLATANLDIYEALARPIVQQFKDFKYYKVKAATTDTAYLDSAFSPYDEGRIDYTVDEFYNVVKGVGMGIPMARLFIAASPIGIGTNAYWYDNCGSGYMRLQIAISGTNGVVTATLSNFVESLFYNLLTGEVDCGPLKRKILISNGGMSGNIPVGSMSGNLTGSVTFTGDYAGKFNSIVIPVVSMEILPGTTTVVYNGQTVPNFPFTF